MKITLVGQASSKELTQDKFLSVMDKVVPEGKPYFMHGNYSKVCKLYPAKNGNMTFFAHIVKKLSTKHGLQASRFYTGGYNIKINNVYVYIDIQDGHRISIKANPRSSEKDLKIAVKFVNEYSKLFLKHIPIVSKIGQVTTDIKTLARKYKVAFADMRFMGFARNDGSIDMTVCPARGLNVDIFSDDFISEVMRKYSSKYKFLDVEVAGNVAGDGVFSIDSAVWYK